jgi:excisionase family DNA binding protein
MTTAEFEPTQDVQTDDRLPACDLLTVHEAAQLLKVSVSWVYQHLRPDTEDGLPLVKIGRSLRFDRRDLHAYIDVKRAASRRQHR